MKANRWICRTIPLKFALGEIALFSINFELAVLDSHFTEMTDDAFVNWSDWSDLPKGVHGILIRSQPVTARIERIKVFPKALRYVPSQFERYFMEFGVSFDRYLKKFSSKSRSNRKRELKKFAELSGGEIDWREYRTVSEVTGFLTLALALSKLTFQERLLNSGLPDDEAYRKNMIQLASEGKIRAFILFLGGKAVSYLLTEIRDPGILIYRYLGYDPEYQTLSPGMVLHMKAFEKLFADGDLRMLDFTEGEGTHKEYFSTGSKKCADTYFFRRTLKIRMILAAHTATEAFSRVTVKILDRLGVKARVKKLIRKWA